jgi:hypothetical protein
LQRLDRVAIKSACSELRYSARTNDHGEEHDIDNDMSAGLSIALRGRRLTLPSGVPLQRFEAGTARDEREPITAIRIVSPPV